MTQDVGAPRTGALVPLTRDEVSVIEAKSHVLGLSSLVGQAESIDDDDLPFPLEADGWLDEHLSAREQLASFAQHRAEGAASEHYTEDPAWD